MTETSFPTNLSALYATAIEVANRELTAYTPMASLLAREVAPNAADAGIRTVTIVHKNRMGQPTQYDPVAYPATSGYKPFTDGTGPQRSMTPVGYADTRSVRQTDIAQMDQFRTAVAEIAQAYAVAPDDLLIRRIQSAASTSVTYTTDAGSKTNNIITVAGSPGYLKDGTSTYYNKIASNLSDTNLEAALALIRNQKNWADGYKFQHRPQFVLLVPPGMQRMAETLTSSTVIPYNPGAGLGDMSNWFTGQQIGVLVSNLLTSSTKTWLIDVQNTPIKRTTFQRLKIAVQEHATPQRTEVSATLEIGVEFDAYAPGIVEIGA